jgi:hypothetical protein
MNLKGFSNILIVSFLILNVFSGLGQDLIITKKGQDISAKVLEISLTTVKYKRFDNINGPIYNIPKSDVLMIRYQNGTKELLTGNSLKNENQTTNIQPNLKEEVSQLDNPNEVIKKELKKSINEPQAVFKDELKKEELPKFTEKSTIPTQILSNEFVKYKNKKLFWGIGTILTASVGAFCIIQSNTLYTDYKTATTQANSIHSQIESLNIVSPIAFALAGLSAIEFFVQHSKQNKVVKFKVIPDKNAVSGIRLGINYSF